MTGAWITGDREEMRKIMAGWEELGHLVAHPGRAFTEPAHTSSGDPAYFTAWMCGGYPEVERGYLGAADPARTGILRVLFWLQPGRGRSILDPLYEALVSHIDTFETPLAFFPPTPIEDSTRTGDRGDAWHVEGLEFPFVAA